MSRQQLANHASAQEGPLHTARDPAATRRDDLVALEADVHIVLEHAGRSTRAHGRLLARLTSGTAAANAVALDDIVAAVQRELIRLVRGDEPCGRAEDGTPTKERRGRRHEQECGKARAA